MWCHTVSMNVQLCLLTTFVDNVCGRASKFQSYTFPLPIKCTHGLTDPPYIIHTSWPTHTHTSHHRPLRSMMTRTMNQLKTETPPQRVYSWNSRTSLRYLTRRTTSTWEWRPLMKSARRSVSVHVNSLSSHNFITLVLVITALLSGSGIFTVHV